MKKLTIALVSLWKFLFGILAHASMLICYLDSRQDVKVLVKDTIHTPYCVLYSMDNKFKLIDVDGKPYPAIVNFSTEPKQEFEQVSFYAVPDNNTNVIMRINYKNGAYRTHLIMRKKRVIKPF